ncbi:MAG TPA: GAF domain-containing protein, partial [Gaiellaceae bacterium]|nr:GAF domain-containing protein [Gaiellaceae bacterium]
MEVAQHRARQGAAGGAARTVSPVEALGRVAAAVAADGSLGQVLAAAADALLEAVGGTVVVVRAADADGQLCARGVAAASPALAAELEASRVAPGRGGGEEVVEVHALPAPLREIATRVGADAVAVLPVSVAGVHAGSLEAFRVGARFEAHELDLLRAAAAHVAAAIRALADGHAGRADDVRLVELAGEALSAGSDARGAEDEPVRLAVDATAAAGATLWRPGA